MSKEASILRRVRFAIGVNHFVTILRSIPLIKSIIPYDFMRSKSTKSILGKIVFVLLFTWQVFKKVMYFGFVYALLEFVFGGFSAAKLYQAMIALTICGALGNSPLLSYDEIVETVVLFLRVDGKKTILSMVYSNALHLVIALILCVCSKLPLIPFALVTTLMIAMKIALPALVLKIYTLTGQMYSNANIKAALPSLSLIVISFALMYYGMVMPEWVMIVVVLFSVIGAIVGLNYLYRFDDFLGVIKNTYALMQGFKANKSTMEFVARENYVKKISDDGNIISRKKGYARFNEIFFRRHRRLISKNYNLISLFLLAVVVLSFFGINVSSVFKEILYIGLSESLGFVLILAYFLNTFTQVTQIMFMSCDVTMLGYNFYRKRKVILKLYMERLKTLIYLSLKPAGILAAGYTLLLYSCSPNVILQDLVLGSMCIIFWMIFFSIHSLTMYYLLQPFNKMLKQKSFVYSIASTLTYLVCYSISQITMELSSFVNVSIIFCVIYILASAILVYLFAPKTFCLKK